MITDYLETSIASFHSVFTNCFPLNSPECPIPWFMQVCCPPKKNKSLLKLTIVYYYSKVWYYDTWIYYEKVYSGYSKNVQLTFSKQDY